MNRLKYLSLLGVTALLSCCTNSNKATEQTQTEAIAVNALRIQNSSTSNLHNYVAVTEEEVSTALSFSTGGYIEKVYVKEGDFVKKSQLIATINKSDAQNAYNTAKASLDQANDAYKRLKQVYDNGSLAEIKWVEMQTNLTKAESMYGIAKKRLEDCELYSPQDAYIGKVYAKSGINMSPLQTVVTLLKIDNIYINFTVPESEISGIKIGQDARFTINAVDNNITSGGIVEIGISANPVSHSYPVRIKAANSNHRILPGMICNVYISDKNTKSGFVVPTNAILIANDNSKFVWLIENGKAVRRSIKISGYSGVGVLVSEGLNTNDLVIVEGYQKVSEGMLVTAQTEQ
ncbi:MAG: Toluene efflux pump periplasmic linker protein TtgG precursor [Bacteroidetes bacterium ADurb.Bin302]|nr:MAG: Toluene efflux pump periplasmic linker protein TtgG precursor [Bacteroidetes bacterium ADurb.Bin302]